MARSAIHSVLSHASGISGKSWRISERRLQVVLLPLELESLRVVDRGSGLHAQQGVVSDGVLAPAVMAVVRRHERGVDGPGDLDQARVRPPLRLEAVILQLDEEVLPAEDVLKTAGEKPGALEVLGEKRLEHHAPEAPGGGDETVVMALEELPVHPGLVVVALEIGGRRQLDQVAVALGGLGEECQVVVELLATIPLAAGVVDAAASPDRSLVPGGAPPCRPRCR